MLFNDLPDELLVYIFDEIFDMKQLIEMSKVCSRWHQLILQRFSKVTCIEGERNITSNKRGKVLIKHSGELKGLNLNYWFPRLKIADFTLAKIDIETSNGIECHQYSNTITPDEAVTLISNTPTLKGVIIRELPRDLPENRVPKFENVEMLSSYIVDSYFERYFDPVKLTQLHLSCCEVKDLYLIAEYRNLIRLHIDVKTNELYTGPKFFNLKILEFGACWEIKKLGKEYPGFHFMDYCPFLEHAYFEAAPKDYEGCINESIKNLNLKSLVVSPVNVEISFNQTWPSIKSLFSKFPNLENFAIRKSYEITDDHVPELVELLPKLRILDFAPWSFNITEKSDQFLASYCKKSGRSIVIYHNLSSDPTKCYYWSKMNEACSPVCNGFDFVRNCFFRNFRKLPNIMDT